MKNIQTIGYQGIPGAYSYIATSHLFPKENLAGFSSFEEVFQAINNNSLSKAVLPIENALIGSIYEVYDLLFEYSYSISGEVILSIDHTLLGIPGTSLNQVTTVYSHKKALDQCKQFFRDNPTITPIVFEDTAAAAKMVAEKNDPKIAAIASFTAGTIYKLSPLALRIQSNPNNFTRFVVVEKNHKEQTGNKTSIVFSAAHQPGSLIKCLTPFDQAHLNLTKIESRPFIGFPWKYLFYLDVEHSNDHDHIEPILEQIKPATTLLRVLGTYNKGETIHE